VGDVEDWHARVLYETRGRRADAALLEHLLKQTRLLKQNHPPAKRVRQPLPEVPSLGTTDGMTVLTILSGWQRQQRAHRRMCSHLRHRAIH
jgi:hypothetical protein